MEIHLNTWLGQHLWAWWLMAFVLVLTAAVLARRGTVLAAAAGPALAAATAALMPDSFWVQAGVAASVGVLAVAGAALLRRREHA